MRTRKDIQDKFTIQMKALEAKCQKDIETTQQWVQQLLMGGGQGTDEAQNEDTSDN